MTNIAIYTESSNDHKTIECLSNKLAKFKQVKPVVIHQISKGSYFRTNPNRVILDWLKKVDCIIFLTDRDGPMANLERQNSSKSLISRIKPIIDNNKVFHVEIVHELEAWLLVDCLGIFCYYATTKNAKKYKNNCRHTVSTNRSLKNWVNNQQIGDTEKIVEAIKGSRNAKEYLREISEDILCKLNPNMRNRKSNLKREKYSPSMSPKIAAFICINKETLGRNKSLGRFSEVIAKFK